MWRNRNIDPENEVKILKQHSKYEMYTHINIARGDDAPHDPLWGDILAQGDQVHGEPSIHIITLEWVSLNIKGVRDITRDIRAGKRVLKQHLKWHSGFYPGLDVQIVVNRDGAVPQPNSPDQIMFQGSARILIPVLEFTDDDPKREPLETLTINSNFSIN